MDAQQLIWKQSGFRTFTLAWSICDKKGLGLWKLSETRTSGFPTNPFFEHLLHTLKSQNDPAFCPKLGQILHLKSERPKSELFDNQTIIDRPKSQRAPLYVFGNSY